VRAGVERDNLEDAKNEAMAYRVKEIKHLENLLVLCTRNQLACEANAEKAAAQQEALAERLEHEEAKLAKYAAELAEVEVRILAVALF
jgi:hypothetical protein